MSTAFSLNPVDNRIVTQKSIRIDKKKKKPLKLMSNLIKVAGCKINIKKCNCIYFNSNQKLK